MSFLEWLVDHLGKVPPTAPLPRPRPAKEPVPLPSALAPALFEAINRFRDARGLAPLVPERKLLAAAQEHALAMAGSGVLAHEDADGELMAVSHSFKAIGACIARGQPTAQSVVHAWAADPLFREILLGPYMELGADAAQASSGVLYFCAIFATPLE